VKNKGGIRDLTEIMVPKEIEHERLTARVGVLLIISLILEIEFLLVNVKKDLNVFYTL